MQEQRHKFEHAIWPHFRSAWNLARWIVGNPHDADDVVQESFVRAFRAVDRVRIEDGRAWLLAIVRNTALNHLQRAKPKEEVSWDNNVPEPPDREAGAEAQLLQRERRDRVHAAIERLPPEFREPLLLREIEGLSYKEIAWVLKIPIGTVMSRLSRARRLLMQDLVSVMEECHDLHGS